MQKTYLRVAYSVKRSVPEVDVLEGRVTTILAFDPGLPKSSAATCTQVLTCERGETPTCQRHP